MKERIMIIESSNGFTMCLADVKGGPIISGKTLEEAEKKFKEAYNLCSTIQLMMRFISQKNIQEFIKMKR